MVPFITGKATRPQLVGWIYVNAFKPLPVQMTVTLNWSPFLCRPMSECNPSVHRARVLADGVNVWALCESWTRLNIGPKLSLSQSFQTITCSAELLSCLTLFLLLSNRFTQSVRRTWSNTTLIQWTLSTRSEITNYPTHTHTHTSRENTKIAVQDMSVNCKHARGQGLILNIKKRVYKGNELLELCLNK